MSRVWRVPADVDTDQLAPGSTMKHGIAVSAAECLSRVRSDFAASVCRGDVIVAGANFGIGSSREQAASVLVYLGVAAVIAPSFSGLYFRNAFNVGLLLIVCADAASLDDGDTVEVDARNNRILRAGGSVLACTQTPAFLLDLVDAGGLLPRLKQRLEERRCAPNSNS